MLCNPPALDHADAYAALGGDIAHVAVRGIEGVAGDHHPRCGGVHGFLYKHRHHHLSVVYARRLSGFPGLEVVDRGPDLAHGGGQIRAAAHIGHGGVEACSAEVGQVLGAGRAAYEHALAA
ncbi:hypothetical protein SDC9_197382 [bioreactor metagenome]|uniref:Uncharacterized protein n=1 Tax=bioreactor metagenome TaxID=1076179 RepID=A0A645IF70_9ZZZZ